MTEGSDGNGIEKVNLDKVDWRCSREFFESLGETLDRLDDKDESYDFTWVGKRKAVIEAGAPINKTLRPDVDASKNWDTTENLFIEGDNLDALKLLQESYLGKVKMIYIDPPYNTGKDFVYHDNFAANTQQYDEDTDYHDEDGNIQFKKNEKSNGRYHSDWLSMMYPRLKLSRNLLSDDGVIFISIDENEQANLKKMCDEIYDEDNLIGNIAWRRFNSQANIGMFATVRDNILVYAKSMEAVRFGRIPLTETAKKEYQYKDDSGIYARRPCIDSVRGRYVYDVTLPNGNVLSENWMISEAQFREEDEKGLIHWPQNGGNPMRKIYLADALKSGQIANDFWGSEFGNNKNSTEEIKKLFDGKRVFDFPKPTKLLKNLLGLGAPLADDSSKQIVLDFFSGSASTADAVMQLNAEDGGNRKWIMVQLPEETDEKSEAYKAGYKTIPEISRERIRRAGDKIASEHPDAKVDYGFRALRVDETNYKEVYKSAGEYQQAMLESLVDNVKDDRSDLDLLYGVLTQSAFELNRPLETVDIAGATVYKYDYFGEVSGLVACFAPHISEEAIKQIAQLKPLTAVFRESSFPNSQAKVNLAEHFRILSPDTKVKVI